jgi:sterol desaturase/sphingolipid hydroxylase (fatty acid hydroxylase superfamily)
VTRIEQLAHRVLALGDDVREHVWSLLFDPSARTFWGGLLFSALVVGVLALRRRGTSLRARQFWNPSARVDYSLILANPIVFAVMGLPTLLTTLGVAMGTIRLLRGWWGPMGALQGTLSVGVVTALYTVVLFVAWDASRFALHAVMHRSNLLWQFHQVHHSATSLTPLTLYRVHPVESILYRLRGVLVTGVLTGVFSYAFGPRTVEFQLWGVNALGFVFSVVSGNLRHSHVAWSFGPWLERWLISPAQHLLHHAPAPEHCGANLGTWLAVWDRMAGTWRPASDVDLRFGLPPEHCNHRSDSMLSALFDPVLSIAGRLLRPLQREPRADRSIRTDAPRPPAGQELG